MTFGGAAQLADRSLFNLVTYESAGGVWQIQLNATITGSARLNVVHRDDRWVYQTAYCLGEEPFVHLVVTRLVTRWLETLPEDFDLAAFRAMVPHHNVERFPDGGGRELRPITTDPGLVDALGRLAGFDEGGRAALVKVVCRPVAWPDFGTLMGDGRPDGLKE